MASAWDSTLNYNFSFFFGLKRLEDELKQAKDISIQIESYTFYKCVSWKDLFGSSVVHDVENRSYPINIYDIMTPGTIQKFQSENDYG